MVQIDIENPFVVGKYVSDKYFCDCEAEVELLMKVCLDRFIGSSTNLYDLTSKETV